MQHFKTTTSKFETRESGPCPHNAHSRNYQRSLDEGGPCGLYLQVDKCVPVVATSTLNKERILIRAVPLSKLREESRRGKPKKVFAAAKRNRNSRNMKNLEKSGCFKYISRCEDSSYFLPSSLFKSLILMLLIFLGKAKLKGPLRILEKHPEEWFQKLHAKTMPLKQAKVQARQAKRTIRRIVQAEAAIKHRRTV